MAAIIANNQLIDAPPISQIRYGLFTAAQGPFALDTRGIGSGVQFLTDHCDGANLYDANCTTNPTKVFVEGSDTMAAEPFWVYAKKHCGTVGRTPGEIEQAVRQQLISGEQQQVEAAIWTGGGIGVAPNLSASAATVVTPSAPGAGAAIAALEEAAYDTYGYNGVIHINTRAYGALAYAQLLVRDGAQLKTPIGTVWSIGSGYPITGLLDVAPAAGFVWAFMTSTVTMWRSEIMVPSVTETIDRTLNQYNATAERVYAVTWDCPQVFAVQVPIAAPATAATPAVP